jgi:glycosyltransferase involved in cell wall biosynthesis
MRVGLNLTFLGKEAGGVGRYAEELAAALASRSDVSLHVVASDDLPDRVRSASWAASVPWTVVPVSARRPRLHLAGQLLAVGALATARDWDVVHSPANVGPVCLPRTASVITMHDVIWLHAGDSWGPADAVRAMWRVSVPTVRRASQVIAVSAAASSEIVTELGLDPRRVSVAAHGVRAPSSDALVSSADDVRTRVDLGSGPIVLCVAQKRPYKNQEQLIRAFRDVTNVAARLVLVGATTAYEQRLVEVARECGLTDRVIFTGWLPDADLEGLYAAASCFVLPSRMEGFGLPVLEAMARGLPVACSDIPSLVEVAGPAALLFDPYDAASITYAIDRLLTDGSLRARLIERGRARAMTFTWAATADATVAAYRRAIG